MTAVVLTEEEKKLELLQLYFSTVVQREILDRYKVNNENVLRILLKFLLNSNYITISKLFNNLKSMGLSVGKTTMPNALNNLKKGGSIISLIKPHYESPREYLEKGRLKDEFMDEVLEKTKRDIVAVGGKVVSLIESPIVGEKGKNKEFLVLIQP